MSEAPKNRRIAKGSSAPRAAVDPISTDDESPIPKPTTTSVRPPPAPIEKKSKPVSKVRRSLELFAGVVVVAAASLAVAWGAHRYVTTSPRFAVKTVAIEGAHRRSVAMLAELGGLSVGRNIFSIDPVVAGASIANDPWVEKATVTRKLPTTINVSVVEREPAALVSIGGELYLATREGDLFKRFEADDPDDFPIVTGILPDQVARDRPGAVLAVKRALDVGSELERQGIGKRYPIQELHIELDGSLVVTIGREGILLALGQAPYKEKIAQGARVLNEVAKRKANAAVIFLDNDAHPERVVVRMR